MTPGLGSQLSCSLVIDEEDVPDGAGAELRPRNCIGDQPGKARLLPLDRRGVAGASRVILTGLWTMVANPVWRLWMDRRPAPWGRATDRWTELL